MQEAMSCGLPVLTTDDPAYDGSVVSGSVILCRRDPESFKAAIKGLLADTDRLQGLGIRSPQLAIRHFNWRVNISRLLDAYAGVLCREA